MMNKKDHEDKSPPSADKAVGEITTVIETLRKRSRENFPSDHDKITNQPLGDTSTISIAPESLKHEGLMKQGSHIYPIGNKNKKTSNNNLKKGGTDIPSVHKKYIKKISTSSKTMQSKGTQTKEQYISKKPRTKKTNKTDQDLVTNEKLNDAKTVNAANGHFLHEISIKPSNTSFLDLATTKQQFSKSLKRQHDNICQVHQPNENRNRISSNTKESGLIQVQEQNLEKPRIEEYLTSTNDVETSQIVFDVKTTSDMPWNSLMNIGNMPLHGPTLRKKKIAKRRSNDGLKDQAQTISSMHQKCIKQSSTSSNAIQSKGISKHEQLSLWGKCKNDFARMQMHKSFLHRGKESQQRKGIFHQISSRNVEKVAAGHDSKSRRFFGIAAFCKVFENYEKRRNMNQASSTLPNLLIEKQQINDNLQNQDEGLTAKHLEHEKRNSLSGATKQASFNPFQDLSSEIPRDEESIASGQDVKTSLRFDNMGEFNIDHENLENEVKSNLELLKEQWLEIPRDEEKKLDIGLITCQPLNDMAAFHDPSLYSDSQEETSLDQIQKQSLEISTDEELSQLLEQLELCFNENQEESLKITRDEEKKLDIGVKICQPLNDMAAFHEPRLYSDSQEETSLDQIQEQRLETSIDELFEQLPSWFNKNQEVSLEIPRDEENKLDICVITCQPLSDKAAFYHPSLYLDNQQKKNFDQIQEQCLEIPIDEEISQILTNIQSDFNQTQEESGEQPRDEENELNIGVINCQPLSDMAAFHEACRDFENQRK